MARRYPVHWHPGTLAHIRRHQVRPEEVEEVCDGEPLLRQGKYARTLLIGPTRSGRILTIVLDLRVDGVYQLVTARPSSRKERQQYWVEKGGGSP